MKKVKEQVILIVFGVTLFTTLMNLETVWKYIQNLGNLVYPIFLGILLAFIINVPMTWFQNKLTLFTKKWKHKPSIQVINVLSLLLTLLIITLILVVALMILIPALIDSTVSEINLLQTKWPQIQSYLATLSINTEYITEFIMGIDFESQIKTALNNVSSAASHIASFAGSAVSGAATFGIAFVIAIYSLLSKATLQRHATKLLKAYFKQEWMDRILYVARLVKDTYAKFLSGQCLECIILGMLIFLAFTIFKIPYAALTGLLTGILAFIPYIGALCACIIGALLTMLVDPSKVILCVVVYLSVQVIENHFIYPNVVGNSVGLSPLLTLLAVYLGGKCCGIVGMIMFIPLIAVIYILVKDNVNKRIAITQ